MMGKIGRKPGTEVKPTYDKYVKEEAAGVSSDRKPLSPLCPAPPDDGLASGSAHSL